MNFEHIPTSEIEQDIADTEREIAELSPKEKGFRLIGDRLSVMRADNCRDEIGRRKEFILKLKAILTDRNSGV